MRQAGEELGPVPTIPAGSALRCRVGQSVLCGASTANPITWPCLPPSTAPASMYIPLQAEGKPPGSSHGF